MKYANWTVRFVEIMLITIWTLPIYGGEFVTRKDPLVHVQPPLPSSDEPMLIRENQRIREEADHYFNKPTPPSRDKASREFNIRTDQYRKYEEDMFEWRSRGRELREKYQAPYGFGRYPAGFNEQEIRRIQRK